MDQLRDSRVYVLIYDHSDEVNVRPRSSKLRSITVFQMPSSVMEQIVRGTLGKRRKVCFVVDMIYDIDMRLSKDLDCELHDTYEAFTYLYSYTCRKCYQIGIRCLEFYVVWVMELRGGSDRPTPDLTSG